MQATIPGRKQSGLMLLETLVAILIFSFGILGLVSMQANAISLNTDAKHRADAALLANQLIGRLAVSSPASAAGFAHRSSGTACSPSGSDSSDAAVTDWLAEVNATLPGADSAKQQITVDTSNNVVVIALCWKPTNGIQHKHIVTTQMQWQ